MTKKSLIFAIAFAASLSMAGVASAQRSNFEGFYVGGQVGYSNISEKATGLGVTLYDESADGFGGGGFIGFGGTNGILYGSIEAEVGYDGAQWDASAPVAGFGTVTLDVEAQLNYGVGFRVGAVVADNFLIYGRFGWIRTNVEATLTSTTVSGSLSADEDYDGGRFGGGIEGKFGNIGVRGEYTYTIYEDDDIVASGVAVHFDRDQHLFRVGVAYYF
ncbi:MAG: outer membrane beta-barrel protein [Proteobacteria bacterium]|nr:outer membrane beta-barrel protein [Pseudomonadota bacterium]